MFQLDLSQDEVSSGFGALPTGKYNVVCTDSVIKETKDGTGEYFNVTFEVLDHGFEKRKIFSMYNFKNKNAQAVSIGRKQLKEFLMASGKTDFILKSAHDLIGLTALVGVKIKTDEYGEKNVISYYSKSTTAPASADMSVPFLKKHGA